MTDFEGLYASSEYDDDDTISTPPPPLKPAPTAPSSNSKAKENTAAHPVQIQPKPMPIITPGFSIPSSQVSTNSAVATTTTTTRPGTVPNMVPLLILNGLPQANHNNHKDSSSLHSNNNDGEISKALNQLLVVQKENLSIQKEKLEIKRQKLEFDRLVASHMVQLVPILSNVLDMFSKMNRKRKRKQSDDTDEDDDDEDGLKESKILRTTLERGIKKYMLQEDKEEQIDESDGELDSGIQNDDASVTSDK